MKTAPAFDDVLGKSHLVNTRCELRAPDDTVVGVLPVEEGTITADATRRVERWEGSLTLAGTEWAPKTATDPLAGLSGHYVSVQRAAQPYGTQETWVEVCRLWVYETTVILSRREARLEVTLRSPAALIEDAGILVWRPNAGETVQDMLVRALTQYLPYTPTVLDSTTAEQPPADLKIQRTTPPAVADQLAELANARVYFDALGRIVIRPTLISLDVVTLAPGRQMGISLDVTGYQLTLGRQRFGNDVIVHHEWQNAGGATSVVDGRASISSGPLRVGGPAGRLTTGIDRDYGISQASADKYAIAVLNSMKQAWCTARITAVQDPRVEPDDIIEVEYLDRTLRHRVVGVSFDLTTDAMEVTARTALPLGS